MKNRAFTLVELLVVVLIIGILAAIAVPQYQKAVMKSRYNALKELTRSIADAQEIFYLANGSYAPTFEQLDINMPKPIEITQNSIYRYDYDWGFCHISSLATPVLVKCGDTGIKMDYQIAFQNTKSPGKRVCVIKIGDTSSVQSKICRAETGLNDPSSSSTTWAAWNYPN